jgi:hypothetical protein
MAALLLSGFATTARDRPVAARQGPAPAQAPRWDEPEAFQAPASWSSRCVRTVTARVSVDTNGRNVE